MSVKNPRIQGEKVTSLQRALCALGCAKDDSVAVYGYSTESSVRKFQTQSGLEVDGIVGPRTSDALCAALQAIGLNPSNVASRPCNSGSYSDSENEPVPRPEPIPGNSNESEGVDLSLDLVREFEGFVPKPYSDAVGISTIGYGTTVYPSGEKVSLRDPPISQSKALDYARFWIEQRILPNLRAIPPWRSMNPGQQAALISFAYNLGESFYGGKGFGSITAALNSPNWEDSVPEQISRYHYAGGKPLKGLIRRREYERAVWENGGHPEVS